MKTKQIDSLNILVADEDKSLTQSNLDLDIRDRIIAREVALGVNDSQDNWMEITKSQAEEYQIAMDKAFEEDEAFEEDVAFEEDTLKF